VLRQAERAPVAECLVVVLVDGDPEVLLVEAVPAVGLRAGQQLPGVADGALFEVVAEGEVAVHLEEGAVPRRLADLFDVERADALLHAGRAREWRGHQTGEVGHERHHAGNGEEERGVVAHQ
jgi:hypothetical protein